jgi:hypothetical protein
MKWRRYRFHTDSEDYRPIIFPPPGPWWCSGYSGDSSVIVCYLPRGESVSSYWPEASGVDFTDEEEIVFTSRFPKPDWWTE